MHENFIKKKVKELSDIVGDERAISALSGGVDSTVATVLAHKAVGNQLESVFINTGLMRESEYDKVFKSLLKAGIYTVRLINAGDKFFSALKGLIDPEEKRVAFRDTFYSVFGRVLEDNNAKYLVQGTILTDIEETLDGIKTQHNILEQIGINPEGYGLKIIEPLIEYRKDGVREIAKELGLPASIYERMPFPGPGLAIRVVGEVTPERVDLVRKATTVVEEELAYLKPFQAFAVLIKDQATGIKNGERHYGDMIIVRAVKSNDARTATPLEIDYNLFSKIVKRITDGLPSVVRVLYDNTPKPPATIEYE